MSESQRYDLVVIGSGPGGEKGAAQAAWFGKKVALVERAPEVGGASVHTGTLPSKTLRETALYLTGFRRRELYGMSLRFDRKKSLRQLVGRLRDVTERQTRQIRRNLERHGIALFSGEASFEGPGRLRVADTAGGPGRLLAADVFLIATGSSPLPAAGIDMRDPDVVDSDRILDLDRVPEAMTVVGGGVIGTEYACLFAALGTRITLVEGRDRLLGGVDEELSTGIQLSLERMGAEVILGDAVASVERVARRKTNSLRLALKSGRRLSADKVLFSAGRRGNTQGLGLDRVGVRLNERGHIAVDEHFQTSAEKVYAVGDVVGFPGLASTSMEQGRVAMCHAFGISYKRALASILPYGIYAIPEVATVGASEQELQGKKIPYEVGRARFENSARGQITGDFEGFVKLLFDPSTRRLLGAHVMGEHATELIHVPMLVMASEGPIDVFLDAVFNYPTLSESFKYAAYDGLQRLAQSAASEAAPARAPREATDPATRRWFVGLAPSGPLESGRPVLVCQMDRLRRCRISTWSYDPSGSGLLPPEAEREGFVLAVAASAEIGAPLARILASLGHRILGGGRREDVEIVQARPADLWKGLKDTPAPGRARADSRRRRRYEILRAEGLELPVGAAAIREDQLDAAAAAFAAYLWATHQTRDDPPWVVPAEN
ncbi:MAG TPA: Si-specific NAD(P)(+) transhydrogenase [Thermoanaerobaculia bacterium]|nr:Si-specific NAD(P)(+) transhydrogenase [Thermoanaerobaculia bacterium]